MQRNLNLDYIRRDIYAEMLKWKESLSILKTTLEIEGPRQVGKTFIVKKFAEENFEKVYYANLFSFQDYTSVEKAIELNLSDEDTIKRLFPGFIDSAASVIIIDEVQEYARMYNLIQPVALKMKTHLIVTGSFLGKTIKKEYFKVGAERKVLYLRSLSFAEFLGIFENGERELYETIDLYGGNPAEDYERLKRFYNLYLRIGGYPSVVKKALEFGKLEAAQKGIEEVIKLFCEDSERYMSDITDAEMLPQLLKKIAEYLLRERRGNTRFFDELQKIDFGSETKKKTIEHALSWLMKSGLIAPCGRYNDLKPGSELLNAKYYFTDVGIANHLFQSTDIQSSNRIGCLTENFVYRCILDNKTFERDIPNFATYGDLEIDFFALMEDAQQRKRAIGVEVKNPQAAGKSATELLKTGKLHYLINARSDTYGERDEKIITIPVYLFGRLNIREIVPPYVNPLDTAAQELLTEIKEYHRFD